MNLYLSLTLEEQNGLRHTAPLSLALLWLWLMVAFPLLGLWGEHAYRALWQLVEWNHEMIVGLMVMCIVLRHSYCALRRGA